MGILILPFSGDGGARGGDPDLSLDEIKRRARALFDDDSRGLRTVIEVGRSKQGAQRMFIGEFVTGKDRQLPGRYRWKRIWGSGRTFIEALATAKTNRQRGTPEEETNRPEPRRIIDTRGDVTPKDSDS